MKRLFALFLALALVCGLLPGAFAAAPAAPAEPNAGDVAINATNFPDVNFRSYVSSNFDTNHDGYLSDAEQTAVTSINVSNRNIANMKGIEYFSAVTYLSCSGNSFTELDLLNTNPSIESLYCYNNTKLTSLEVSGHDALTVLDVSGCTALTDLGCVNCDLISLNVKNCTDLQYLECDSNRLTNLDVQTCPALMVLSVYNNKLTSLNLCQNPELWFLNCEHNQLKTLDVSGNPELQLLYCTDNQLTSLDFSGNKDLTTLCCGDNRLTTLDVSGHSSLEYLDVSNNASLKELSCDLCCLTTLHVTGCTALEDLRCAYNQLTALDVSQNTALKELHCFDNQLTTLDVRKNSALEYLWCYSNQLTSLYISGNSLRNLWCYGNNLAALNIGNCPNLIKAYNGNKTEGSNPSIVGMNYWVYYDGDNVLEVDKTTEIKCPKDLGNYTFDFRSGPVERPDSVVMDELALMMLQGKIGAVTENNVSRIDLDLDGSYDFRIYPKDGKYSIYVDAQTNLRGAYTLTVSEEIREVCINAGVDYYSTVTFQYPSPWNPFKDVQESKYYYAPVLWAYYHDPQITNGTDATHFSPDNTCNRGQVVTFLWRAYGCPEPTTTSHSFTDVKNGAYYYKAMLWAVEKGITTGTSATTFGPNKDCTRGQVVTFLWRAAGEPEPKSTSCPFTDVKASASYYKAVLWAVENGITTGTSATTFTPSKTCTRGQVVTFLYRAIAKE